MADSGPEASGLVDAVGIPAGHGDDMHRSGDVGDDTDGADHAVGKEMIAVERDAKLKDVLDQLADCCREYGIQSITATILATGSGYMYGWDGKEKVYVSGTYELHKEETPGAATPRESRN